MMKQSELKAAFPAMPADCRAMLEQTLRTLPDARTRRTPKLIPALALLALLMLGAVACAAAREPILTWLLGYGEPSAELEELAAPLSASTEADGITVTLTGMVFDGENLACSFEAQNADPTRPVLLTLTGTQIDGMDIGEPFDASPLWIPSFHLDILPVQRNPVQSGHMLSPALLNGSPAEGEATVSLTFRILRPVGPLAVIDARMHEDLSLYDSEQRLEIEDQIAAVLSFEGTVSAPEDQSDADAWIAQGYVPIDLSGNVLGDAQALMQEAAELTLTFPLDLSESSRFSFTPDAPLRLDDCTAVVHCLTVSPLSTRLSLELIPDEGTQEAAGRLAAQYGDLTLADGEGIPLAYLDMDYCSGSSPYIAQDASGRFTARYEIDLPGAETVPEKVTLCFGGEQKPDIRLSRQK